MIISYSSPLALPDTLAAVKSTYCLGFQMNLVRLRMTSVSDGIMTTDKASRPLQAKIYIYMSVAIA